MRTTARKVGTLICAFDSTGAKKFGEDHGGKRWASVRDRSRWSDSIGAGDSNARSTAETRRSPGNFTEKEARNLASVLENPLQTPVSVEEERSVSPTLGLDSIRSSIFAGLLGLAITFVLVVIYYKFAGLIANLALSSISSC